MYSDAMGHLSELLAEPVAAPLNDYIVLYFFYLLFPVRESLPLFSFACAFFYKVINSNLFENNINHLCFLTGSLAFNKISNNKY